MGTTIRPELSEKNPYWIEKHRYYELKHFCLQYPIWRKAYSVLDGYSNPPKDLASFVVTSTLGDPTAKCAMAKTYYSERTDMVERVAEQTDRELAEYILKAVTEGWSYDILKARLEIPCCKDVYYEFILEGGAEVSLMIGLLIGIMVGVLLSRFIFREKPVGSLRVDESDPDSGPYLFLELDRSGADAIYKQRYVRLRVELKNYISHK